MKKRTSAEIRQLFLDFFAEKGHAIEPSASLIPVNDPSLLWINSGVAALKKYFDGSEVPDSKRIVNAQKSLRTNDVENVGVTARHQTFFEMLGNFSIGDYFRTEAVTWGWEFLTSPDWIGFDKDKLYVTVYPSDLDTYTLWRDVIGLDESQIVPCEDNFWEVGEGPCGPCTEIFYDRGEAYNFDTPIEELNPAGENERYLEVYNIVFSQYNAQAGLSRDEYQELPTKNIDTGMGLERMVSIIQDGATNYDTDLFLPIIAAIEKQSGKKYLSDAETDKSMKIIADHIRTVTFAIADGALPSNDGRGYVIRRLIRRAVRFARKLGLQKAFLYELSPVVAEIMDAYYPYITENMEFIQKVIRAEEEKFLETLHEGEELLKELLADNVTVLSGEDAFKLYDTYGFPIELTVEYAEEYNIEVDLTAFESAMEAQRERARTARGEQDSMHVQSEVLRNFKVPSEFLGYQSTRSRAKVIFMIQDDELVDIVQAGAEAMIIMDQTPFYAESGGQVADTGVLVADEFQASVLDVQKAPNGQSLHRVLVETGTLSVNMQVEAIVNSNNRLAITRNHTGTHLLHKALKEVLGTHANQAGSLVAPDRLRFDFSHFQALTSEELETVEAIVNDMIWRALPVSIETMSIDDAKERGAMALFGEKYGDVVRVVSAGDESIELCGGIHVQNTAEIGLFTIVSETGIGSGIRRIEAVTSRGAYELLGSYKTTEAEVRKVLKLKSHTPLVQHVQEILAEQKLMQQKIESFEAQLLNQKLSSLENEVSLVNEIPVLALQLTGVDANGLRQAADQLKQKLDSYVIALFAATEEKVVIITAVSKDLNDRGIQAGSIAKTLATICGGNGGGRPDFAQAGGKDPNKINDAINALYTYLEELK
ncbi:alanine--tRNA ligase [Culicoidibacter larvae]|uniref:Alanine--tRNA ligase n=1 Tax=Culicoidibacter larvae TaxID=2579976 RepID=A0A5R8QDA8_9FIRM|nr:alanine--tRNA ligase [Culicoidibacter larvae]TLG74270.1 alanine--tRNA ligase [Culicoidibacter larvae]